MSSPGRPSSIRAPRRSVERTPDPVNDPNNDPFIPSPNRPQSSRVRRRIENNNNNGRRINFINIPNTPSPLRASTSRQPVASPSPRSKLRKLQETKTTDYLEKLMKKHKLNNNNKEDFVTINKNSKINIKNKITDPVFLLSDVYETRDGKVKNVYSKKYLESAWKNRTIFKSPVTGVRTDPLLMVRFNPRLHLNNVIASNQELKRYKENKKIISQTLGEETYVVSFLVRNIKNNITKHSLKLIKYLNKKHGNLTVMATEFLQVPITQIRRYSVATIDMLSKSQVDKTIKVHKKLENLLKKPTPGDEVERYLYEVNRIMFIFYLRSVVIHEITLDTFINFYRILKSKPKGRVYLNHANLSIFSGIINFPPN
jgi:hypothetical protein